MLFLLGGNKFETLLPLNEELQEKAINYEHVLNLSSTIHHLPQPQAKHYHFCTSPHLF